MMSTPARVLKAPSEVAADEAKKGTLHKPAKVEGTEDKKKTVAKVGGKTIKSAETSSTWQEEGAKKPGGLKTRGDNLGGVGGWRSGGQCGNTSKKTRRSERWTSTPGVRMKANRLSSL
jgi:translation initiation factor IF-2